MHGVFPCTSHHCRPRRLFHPKSLYWLHNVKVAVVAAVSRTLQRLIAPEAVSCFTCKTVVLDEHQQILMAEMMDFHCKTEE
ncbi:hypothetical protein V6N13_101532 [Hibiscus sabdariffa]